MIRQLLRYLTTYWVSLVWLSCVLLAVFIRASEVYMMLQKITRNASVSSSNTSRSTLTASAYLPIFVTSRLVLAAAISMAVAFFATVMGTKSRVHITTVKSIETTVAVPLREE